MKALQQLTELFTTFVADAKNIELWAEDGELICTQGLLINGFDIKYTVIIDMSDVNIQPQTLMMHVVSWLNKYDVDRENKGLPLPSFATQLLDNGKCDIKMNVVIQESYSLEERAKGAWQQGEKRFDCVSDFALAQIEDELPPFEFVAESNGDLPPCN